jgi:hypothetical protein
MPTSQSPLLSNAGIFDVSHDNVPTRSSSDATDTSIPVMCTVDNIVRHTPAYFVVPVGQVADVLSSEANQLRDLGDVALFSGSASSLLPSDPFAALASPPMRSEADKMDCAHDVVSSSLSAQMHSPDIGESVLPASNTSLDLAPVEPQVLSGPPTLPSLALPDAPMKSSSTYGRKMEAVAGPSTYLQEAPLASRLENRHSTSVMSRPLMSQDVGGPSRVSWSHALAPRIHARHDTRKSAAEAELWLAQMPTMRASGSDRVKRLVRGVSSSALFKRRSSLKTKDKGKRKALN